jgi:hypothetical protein
LHISPVSPKDFRIYICQGLASLHDIHVTYAWVVDHIGENIVVPTMFCLTWKVSGHITYIYVLRSSSRCQEFDYLINGHCRGLPGQQLIECGDYELICVEDSCTVDLSELQTMVEVKRRLERSVIM